MSQTRPWLLLLYALPTRRNSERVHFWRKVKKFGALPLKNGAYVLPDDSVQYERFQWLSKQVRDGGGEATLIRITEIEGIPSEKIIQAFNDLREKEYDGLARELATLVRKKGKQHPTLGRTLEKLERRFHEIQEIDYFGCSASRHVKMLLRQAEAAPSKIQPTRALKAKDFSKRVWLTRPRPGIDRVGSAWLIRRFIDPAARFKFAESPKAHAGCIPYDMYNVEFSHQGDDCTFETLVRRFRIEDRAVKALAEMVHDADLEDDKFKRVECIGLHRILKGLCRQGLTDEAVLAKGFECFDALYTDLKKA